MFECLEINKLLEQEDFSHHYQGLYSTKNWRRVGSEILFRSKWGLPQEIFQEAKKVNKLFELETKSIIKVLQRIKRQKNLIKETLFINIFPSTILHKDFFDFIKTLAKSTPIDIKIVFEIIETEYVKEMSELGKRIEFLKRSGFQIAIDDVGMGWASPNMIIELQPHYIKLDRYFAADLSSSLLKQEMIKSFLLYANYSNSKVVLEGVEHEEDLATAKYLGVEICQGFLLEKPQLL